MTMAIMKAASPGQWVLLGGLLGATIDIAYALISSGLRGVPAQRLLQSVASGLLGKAAFQGGWPTAALGLAAHYAIVIVAAWLFFLAARQLAWLSAQAVVAGLLYGLAIYGVMNYVVVPLSAVPFKMSTAPAVVLSGIAVHLIGVGLPIALCVRQALKTG